MTRYRFLSTLIALAALAVMTLATACSDDKTYAELLTEENHYVNAFLADQRVINEIPEDTVFQVGPDAPYYRMDSDGQIYMQVLNAGTPGNRVKDDELLFFRYQRYNLSYYKDGKLSEGSGNETDLSLGNTSFRYGNYSLQSSAKWGSGVQLPLAYLPVDCEVNIVIKSQYGFYSEMSQVIPFLYHISYLRPKI